MPILTVELPQRSATSLSAAFAMIKSRHEVVDVESSMRPTALGVAMPITAASRVGGPVLVLPMSQALCAPGAPTTSGLRGRGGWVTPALMLAAVDA